jgi:hypothetical protein
MSCMRLAAGLAERSKRITVTFGSDRRTGPEGCKKVSQLVLKAPSVPIFQIEADLFESQLLIRPELLN